MQSFRQAYHRSKTVKVSKDSAEGGLAGFPCPRELALSIDLLALPETTQ